MSLGLSLLYAFVVIFGLASLFSKDNFYSALYMCLTMVCIGGIYAYLGVHSAFALITLVFVGALGAVTLVLAYTYREEKAIDYRVGWVIFALAIASILSILSPLTLITAKDYVERLTSFEPLFMLFALSVLVMLTLLELWRCRS